MNTIKMMFVALAVVLLLGAVVAPRGEAQQTLTGEVRTSCEILLCLSPTGDAPRACGKALAKFRALQAAETFYPGITVAFLALCPIT